MSQLGSDLKSGRFDGILTELGIKNPFISSLNPKDIKNMTTLKHQFV